MPQEAAGVYNWSEGVLLTYLKMASDLLTYKVILCTVPKGHYLLGKSIKRMS